MKNTLINVALGVALTAVAHAEEPQNSYDYSTVMELKNLIECQYLHAGYADVEPYNAELHKNTSKFFRDLVADIEGAMTDPRSREVVAEFRSNHRDEWRNAAFKKKALDMRMIAHIKEGTIDELHLTDEEFEIHDQAWFCKTLIAVTNLLMKQ